MDGAHMPAYVSLNNTPTLIQRVDEEAKPKEPEMKQIDLF